MQFLELYNSSATGTVNLSGMQFNAGITLTLGNLDLGPGERAIIVKDLSAFQFRYGNGIRVLGQYSGSLSIAGTVTLVDSTGSEVMSVEFNDADPWPEAADGPGDPLVLINPAVPQQASWEILFLATQC